MNLLNIHYKEKYLSIFVSNGKIYVNINLKIRLFPNDKKD